MQAGLGRAKAAAEPAHTSCIASACVGGSSCGTRFRCGAGVAQCEGCGLHGRDAVRGHAWRTAMRRLLRRRHAGEAQRALKALRGARVGRWRVNASWAPWQHQVTHARSRAQPRWPPLPLASSPPCARFRRPPVSIYRQHQRRAPLPPERPQRLPAASRPLTHHALPCARRPCTCLSGLAACRRSV